MPEILGEFHLIYIDLEIIVYVFYEIAKA